MMGVSFFGFVWPFSLRKSWLCFLKSNEVISILNMCIENILKYVLFESKRGE